MYVTALHFKNLFMQIIRNSYDKDFFFSFTGLLIEASMSVIVYVIHTLSWLQFFKVLLIIADVIQSVSVTQTHAARVNEPVEFYVEVLPKNDTAGDLLSTVHYLWIFGDEVSITSCGYYSGNEGTITSYIFLISLLVSLLASDFVLLNINQFLSRILL